MADQRSGTLAEAVAVVGGPEEVLTISSGEPAREGTGPLWANCRVP